MCGRLVGSFSRGRQAEQGIRVNRIHGQNKAGNARSPVAAERGEFATAANVRSLVTGIHRYTQETASSQCTQQIKMNELFTGTDRTKATVNQARRDGFVVVILFHKKKMPGKHILPFPLVVWMLPSAPLSFFCIKKPESALARANSFLSLPSTT